MNRRIAWIPVVVAALVLAGAALAGDAPEAVTVEGKLLCAKCSLGEEDFGGCQSVVVTSGGEKLYLVKNALAEKDGHVCKSSKQVKVTGTVTDKDGRKWIEATEIAEVKS